MCGRSASVARRLVKKDRFYYPRLGVGRASLRRESEARKPDGYWHKIKARSTSCKTSAIVVGTVSYLRKLNCGVAAGGASIQEMGGPGTSFSRLAKSLASDHLS